MVIDHEIDARTRVLWCINAALEKKAKDIVVLNVKDLSSFTDYFVIASGNSDRQVQAIASAIREEMKRNNFLPLGVEGENYGHWVLMDYDDLVVHIFYEPERRFYEIERLWSQAPKMEVDEKTTKLSALTEEI